MRSFIILCLVGAAFGQYNYGAGQSGVGSDSPSTGAGGFPFPPSGGYTKEFYTFVAPEEKIDPRVLQKLVNMVKKNIRVIFIKNPENNAYENAVLNLVKQAAQQKTAIYVLQKQHDLADLANKFNAIHDNANAKPEVHFVKYRTPEDAANAQRTIQSQYDSLGGPSHNINGGVAPALNFASQSPSASSPAAQVSPLSPGLSSSPISSVPQASPASRGTLQIPQSEYLPASLLRSLRKYRRF